MWAIGDASSEGQLKHLANHEERVVAHNLAHPAWEAGFYDGLVVPVDGVDLARDEGIRPGSSAEMSGSSPPSAAVRRSS